MTSSQQMMKLGDYKFSLNTACYQTLSNSRKFRWQPIARINQLSAMQYLGADNPAITLTGTFFPQLMGSASSIDAMIKEASRGKPLLLVDGLGVVHGYWVITSLDDQQSVFTSRGTAKKITFTLGLRFYAGKLHNH